MESFCSRYVIYPLYERLTGRRVLSKLRAFEETQWLPRSRIESLQRKRLREMLRHASRHVPFYRRRVRALGCSVESLGEAENLRRLPLLTKEDILTHRDELVAMNYPTSELKPNATGGSTGHTLSFYNSRESLDYRSAVTIRGDRWAGLDIGISHARLWGAPLDIDAQERLINRLSNAALNRIWLDCFHLSEDILAHHVERLRKHRPQVLVGYASALATLAGFVQARHIRDLRLASVISSAETLFDEQREQIEAALDCNVYNRYGCREAGPLIVECEEGRMHVNADYIYLEILKNGRPAEPGETGEVVVTPLYGYGMPLIRYQVGDVAVAAEQAPCPCGRGLPVVERVVGRTSEMLINSTGELFHGEYFTHLFYGRSEIRQFQLVQPSPDRLVFNVVTDLSFHLPLFQQIEEKIVAEMGPMNIEWQRKEEIPPQPSGKRSFTISHVSGNLARSDATAR